MKIHSVIDASQPYPLVTVKMVSEEGVNLNEYQCTIDQYAESLFDSLIREYRKVRFLKFRSLKAKPLYDRTEKPCPLYEHSFLFGDTKKDRISQTGGKSIVLYSLA